MNDAPRRCARPIRPKRHIRLDSLEDRVLFDAVPMVDPELARPVECADLTHIQSCEAPESRTVVFFIDSRIEDPDSLIADIPPVGGNSELHFLDNSADGLEQIADYLDGRSDIDAIHILSHGDRAELVLGDAVIRGDDLGLYADELRNIGSALSPDADILFHGCDLASGSAGVEFVQRFANLTGADVAASANLTETGDLGGDRRLETHVRDIEVSGVEIMAYRGILLDAAASLNTTPESVNPLSYTGSDNQAYAIGNGDDIVVNGAVTESGLNLTASTDPTKVKVQTLDNPLVMGIRTKFLAQQPSSEYDLATTYPSDGSASGGAGSAFRTHDAVGSRAFRFGLSNTFMNSADGTRLESSGSIDSSGEPSSYGNLVTASASDMASASVVHDFPTLAEDVVSETSQQTFVPDSPDFKRSTSATMDGTLATSNDLELSSAEQYSSVSLFSDDASNSSDLTDTTDSPLTTQLDGSLGVVDADIQGDFSAAFAPAEVLNNTSNVGVDLYVAKDDGDTSSVAGDTIIYTIAYGNNGTTDATGVVLSETLPTGTTFSESSFGWNETSAGSGIFEWELNTIGAGVSGSVEFAVKVNDPLEAGIDEIVSRVSIADDGSNGTDADASDNVAEDTNNVSAAPDLFVNKDDGSTTATVGETIVYTLEYGNNGTQGATSVLLTETLPPNTTFDADNSSSGWVETAAGSGVFTYSIGPVEGGGSGEVSFAIKVGPPATGVTELTNTALIADDGANGADAQTANNRATDTNTIATVDLAVTKDDGMSTAMPGDEITYSIVVENKSTQGATGVTVTDDLPSSVLANVTASNGGVVDLVAETVTWNLANLGAGESVTLTITGTVTDTFDAGVDTFTNSVSVTDDGSHGNDIDTSNNSHTDTNVLDAAPELSVSKSDQGVTANPGDVVVYTIDYANNGTQAATGVVLTETLPDNTTYDAANSESGWTETAPGSGQFNLAVGDLSAGESGSVTFAARVDASVPAGTNQINNRVDITDNAGNGADPDITNNTSTDATPLSGSNYTISKEADVDSIEAGQRVTYAITVTNGAPLPASDIQVMETFTTDVFDSVVADNGGIVDLTGGMITWNLPSLGAGESVVLEVTADVLESIAADIDVIHSETSVTDNGQVVVTATDSVTLNAAPELQIGVTTDALAANTGATIVYTITFMNHGTQDATGVVIEEHLLEGTAFDASNSDSGWIARGDGEHIDFTVGDLAAGESRSVAFAVTVTDASLIGETLNNIVDVRDDGGNGADPVAANNSAQIALSTADHDTPQYDISRNTSVTEISPDGTLTYTISVTNNGTAAGSDVVIKESLDIGIFDQIAADRGGVVDLEEATIAWNVDSLAIDETIVLSVTADVASSVAAGIDTVHGTATVEDDNAAAVASADGQLSLVAAPELAINKTIDADEVSNGDVLVYTITYTNQGNQNATGVLIEEHIVAGTTFNADASDDGWVDRSDGEHIDFAVGDLAAGEERTIQFAVTVDEVDKIGDRLINLVEIGDDGNNGSDADQTNNVGLLGVSTKVLSADDISKRHLLTTTSTGAYDMLVRR